jgi:hypothetical protein
MAYITMNNTTRQYISARKIWKDISERYIIQKEYLMMMRLHVVWPLHRLSD